MPDYQELREEADRRWRVLVSGDRPWIRVGAAMCGHAAGAFEVIDALRRELDDQGIAATVSQVGCLGICFAEPLMDIQKAGRSRLFFRNVTPDDVGRDRPGLPGRRQDTAIQRRRLPRGDPYTRRRGPGGDAGHQIPAADCAAQRGPHRARRYLPVHRPRRLLRPPEGGRGDGAPGRNPGDHRLRPSGQGRGRLPHRREVEFSSTLARPDEVYPLQLRGGGPRGLQRQGHPGERPADTGRGDGHRRIRHRRDKRDHIHTARPRRPHRPDRAGDRAGLRAGPAGTEDSSAPTSATTSRCPSPGSPTSPARSRPSWSR